MNTSTRRWLARLSFSFFILAMVLAWEVWRIQNGTAPPQPAWRIALYLIGILIGAVLGFIGLRERHRPENTDDRE